MPLHLLGKKSWNVYNADNIARVRRDEAAAKAAEEAEESRMQEVDAQRRIAILRGEHLPPLEDVEVKVPNEMPGLPSSSLVSTAHRRKRRRHGEDDTDFEMRLAKERDALAIAKIDAPRKATKSAPIVDRDGHIDLFGDEKGNGHVEKNEEAERESRKKQREYEDQYTMRFSNAVGKHGANSPWYSQSDPTAVEPPSRDAWGNEDPRRKEREAQRIITNDPLALMKKGASKVRELKQERQKFQSEREEELKRLRREDRHREKRQRRHKEREGRERPRSRGREDHQDSDDRRKRRCEGSRNADERRRRRDSRSPDRGRNNDGYRRHRHRDD